MPGRKTGHLTHAKILQIADASAASKRTSQLTATKASSGCFSVSGVMLRDMHNEQE